MMPKAPAINTEGKIASPSKPSVKFTAFEEPTTTKEPKRINIIGPIGIIKSLTKGVINDISATCSAEKYK